MARHNRQPSRSMRGSFRIASQKARYSVHPPQSPSGPSLNKPFANAIVAQHLPCDIVLIHEYGLLLLQAALTERIVFERKDQRWQKRYETFGTEKRLCQLRCKSDC